MQYHCPQRAHSTLDPPLSTDTLPLHPHPFSTLDNPKVEVMTPDVTDQTDKEQGLLWADAQLWAQLCTVVRPACSLRERERETERRRERKER